MATEIGSINDGGIRISTDYISSSALTASITGDAIDLKSFDEVCIQANWTASGTPAGTFTIEISNDASTWDTYSGSSTALSGTVLTYTLTNLSSRYVRLKYTRSSGGTGDTLSATYVLKKG